MTGPSSHPDDSARSIEAVAQLAHQSAAALVLIYLWPELEAIKLTTTGDARFVPAAHRLSEGVDV